MWGITLCHTVSPPFSPYPTRFSSPLAIPRATPRYPFRNTVVARDAIDAIDFRPHIFIFPVFLFTPPFLSLYFHFFLLLGGKYRKYCIYCTPLCFEPKFDQRVKTRSIAEVLQIRVNLLHEIPSSVLDWWSGWGCRWCCAIVWCNRLRGKYCSGG